MSSSSLKWTHRLLLGHRGGPPALHAACGQGCSMHESGVFCLGVRIACSGVACRGQWPCLPQGWYHWAHEIFKDGFQGRPHDTHHCLMVFVVITCMLMCCYYMYVDVCSGDCCIACSLSHLSYRLHCHIFKFLFS